jgi:hypothetical protein
MSLDTIMSHSPPTPILRSNLMLSSYILDFTNRCLPRDIPTKILYANCSLHAYMNGTILSHNTVFRSNLIKSANINSDHDSFN